VSHEGKKSDLLGMDRPIMRHRRRHYWGCSRQAPQGQEPGLLENLSSDAIAFYQRYRLYILAVLAVVFLRWLWTAVTPRGYRD
jgi:hypothetical protein